MSDAFTVERRCKHNDRPLFDDKGKPRDYFRCMQGIDRDGYCLYHWVHANPASTNDDDDDLSLQSYSGWIRDTPYRYSKNGALMSETITVPTPTHISKRFFNTEERVWENVSYDLAVATHDMSPCAGTDKCFIFINRGHYCSKHVLHAEVSQSA